MYNVVIELKKKKLFYKKIFNFEKKFSFSKNFIHKKIIIMCISSLDMSGRSLHTSYFKCHTSLPFLQVSTRFFNSPKKERVYSSAHSGNEKA